jgi:hypothetical protein
VNYRVSKFDSETDMLVSEEVLEGVDASALAALFGESLESFVESYPIGGREAAYLRATFGVDIDLDSGEYLLEVFA